MTKIQEFFYKKICYFDLNRSAVKIKKLAVQNHILFVAVNIVVQVILNANKEFVKLNLQEYLIFQYPSENFFINKINYKEKFI